MSRARPPRFRIRRNAINPASARRIAAGSGTLGPLKSVTEPEPGVLASACSFLNQHDLENRRCKSSTA